MGTETKFARGDILESDAEALVNTVNCVGIMGRGVALQFKNAYPANFKAYETACGRGEVQPGRMFVFETGRLTPPQYIINFPTKRHWRGKSRIEDIKSGLAALVEEIRNRGIRSVAIPPLGSGMGGLHWPDVRPLILAALRPLEGVRAVVYEPSESLVPRQSIRSAAIPTMNSGRAVLIQLMESYLRGLLDPSITLLEVHKLMYFMQEAGEPLRLKFAEAPFGPYAENLRHVLKRIEGYFIAGYADGGDTPSKPLSLVPGAVEEAELVLRDHPATRARARRVAELVEGFESPLGLELLATSHWVIRHHGCRDLMGIAGAFQSWSPRKSRFTMRQITIAAKVLTEQGWAGPPDASSSA